MLQRYVKISFRQRIETKNFRNERLAGKCNGRRGVHSTRAAYIHSRYSAVLSHDGRSQVVETYALTELRVQKKLRSYDRSRHFRLADSIARFVRAMPRRIKAERVSTFAASRDYSSTTSASTTSASTASASASQHSPQHSFSASQHSASQAPSHSPQQACSSTTSV